MNEPSEYKSLRTKSRILTIIVVVLLLALLGLIGYLVYDKAFSDNKPEETSKAVEDNSVVAEDKNETKDHAGKYMAAGEPGMESYSYIELFDDGTYKRNHNYCEGYALVDGEYTIEEKDGTRVVILGKSNANSSSVVSISDEISLMLDGNKLAKIGDDWIDCSYPEYFSK